MFKGDVVGFARNSLVRLIKSDPGADDWFAQSYEESAWQPVLCPIGLGYNLADFNVSRGFGGSLPTRIPEFYVRVNLGLSPGQYSALKGIIVRIAADDSADLLVRGVVFASEAAQGKVNVAKYWNHEYHLPKSMLAQGPNIIGAHVINKQTPDTTFFDIEIILSYTDGGSVMFTDAPGVSPTSKPPVVVPAGGACPHGASGCKCKLGNQCDDTLATCESDVCLIRGCVVGEVGCACLAGGMCGNSTLSCEKGFCKSSGTCATAGLAAGCQCTMASTCATGSTIQLRCVQDSFCVNVRQYTCPLGTPGCWCADGDKCTDTETTCENRGIGRKSCIYKKFTDVVSPDTASRALYSLAALLAAVLAFA